MQSGWVLSERKRATGSLLFIQTQQQRTIEAMLSKVISAAEFVVDLKASSRDGFGH